MLDYNRKSLDISSLLPPQHRDKTITKLIRNLFNKQITKEEYSQFFGYVGSKDSSTAETYLSESSLERSINQVSPIIYTKLGTEEKTYTWNDIVQKASILGIDSDLLDEWCKSNMFNFLPPIDLDKFCNFDQYFWIGEWVKNTSVNFTSLGIPLQANLSAAFAQSNEDYKPEYYTIERGTLSSGVPVSMYTDLVGWSGWSLTNLWVHKEDLFAFFAGKEALLEIADVKQATRPIIEYKKSLKLSTRVSVGKPADVGTLSVYQKTSINQPPQFDLYYSSGEHIGATSSIFYYKESQEEAVDEEIGRRVVKDSNTDFVFSQSVCSDNDKQLFFKLWSGSSFSLTSCWSAGKEDSVDYVKYDSTGSIINQDKLVNYFNYYWTGITGSALPSYNLAGNPEYSVIEVGGTSDWSIYNYWKHITELSKESLPLYSQATRPIIEFNKLLEVELIGSKTSFNQDPKFKKYVYRQATNQYLTIAQYQTATGNTYINDAYLDSKILAEVEKIDDLEKIIESNSHIARTCFEVGNFKLAQGLSTGYFDTTQNSIDYGFRAPVAVKTSEFDGSVGNIVVNDSTAIPQVYRLVALTPTTFSVTGSISGTLGTATVGTPFTDSRLSFTISSGATPFTAGNKFILDLYSQIFVPTSYFVKLGANYKTISAPADFLVKSTDQKIVSATPSLKDGTWAVAPQIESNLLNKIYQDFKYGDLFIHFASIISKQVGFIGNEYGSNNWRTISSKDYSVGGIIKQHNDDFYLLVALLLHENQSVLSLLEFAKEEYDAALLKIREFVTQELPNLLAAGDVSSLETSANSQIIERLKDYIAAKSEVILASATKVDDYVQSIFNDSTSPIKGFPITLPALGLADLSQPAEELDLDLGITMLTHHDGHKSTVTPVAIEVYKELVLKQYVRSNGQTTTGFITAGKIPSKPYQNQLWFNTVTNQLLCYLVISDEGSLPDDAVIGQYSYDRQTDTIYRFNGTWLNQGSLVSATAAPWTVIDLTSIIKSSMLTIETELYQKIPTKYNPLSTLSLQHHPRFDSKLKSYFEKFCRDHDILDPYSLGYSPTDAFTWNYSLSALPGLPLVRASWQEIYRYYYGTPRPDLEPWKITQESKAAFLTSVGLISFGPADWSNPAVSNHVKSALTTQGLAARTSVNLSTGALLPPYSTNVEGLLSTIPVNSTAKLNFADGGKYELLWKKTLAYQYEKAKVFFKLNPLQFVSKLWGEATDSINGYEFSRKHQSKLKPSLIQLHGQKITQSKQPTATLSAISTPTSNQEYVFTCVDDFDDTFSIMKNGAHIGFVKSEVLWTDGIINATIKKKLGGFYVDDALQVKVDTDQVLTSSWILAAVRKFVGLNQLYVQSYRRQGLEASVTRNQVLLKDLDVKLGYRFSGFVSSETLQVKSETQVIDSKDYSLLIKENQFLSSSWYSALRIQLVQRGSTARVAGIEVPAAGYAGMPGDDWVFRIDSYNQKRPKITWFTYDQAGSYQTFMALNGERTRQEWKRYTDKTGILTHSAPFLITGIQNVVNFLFGYSDYLAAEGWIFQDPSGVLKIDPNTGRLEGFQLSIEEFVYQQFGGVPAGSAYLLNVAKTAAWFKAPRGVVASVTEDRIIDVDSVQSFSTKTGDKIDQIRVFRDNDLTQFSVNFGEEIYSAHVLVSEYENILSLNQYSSAGELIYDPILGQKIFRLHLSGRKQSIFNGRLSFGGQVLSGGKLKKNIEASVEGITKFYDVDQQAEKSSESENALALIGFEDKKYFSERQLPEKSKVRFWQGMLKHKGTNLAVSAYLNSASYKTAELDEYWAYKIAEYGAARKIKYPELKIFKDDVSTEKTRYLFLEEDELGGLEDWEETGGFDIPALDLRPFDLASIYSFVQASGIELFDPTGSILIKPRDEDRWVTYDDLSSFFYFDAEKLGEKLISHSSLTQLLVVKDKAGIEVKADCFEIEDVTSTSEKIVYFENGQLQSDGSFAVPKFKRINHCTIQILDASLLNKPLLVKWYGPAISRYSPSKVIDYQGNVVADNDGLFWDPARNSHSLEASSAVDIAASIDPAVYTSSITSRKGTLKPWGEKEVGKVWWNTKELDYRPYHDTKINRELSDREAQWGAVADYSSIEVYEWIKTNNHPKDHLKTIDAEIKKSKASSEKLSGEPAIQRTASRTRSWWQRPIVWLHADDPQTEVHGFKSFDVALTLSSTSIGKAKLYCEKRLSAILPLKSIDRIASVKFDLGENKLTSHKLKPMAIFKLSTSAEKLVVGSTSIFEDGGVFAQSPYFTAFAASLEGSALLADSQKNTIGKITLSAEQDSSSAWFLKATCDATGEFDLIRVEDTPVQASSTFSYKFPKFGLLIKLSNIFARAGAWPGNVSEAARKALVAAAIGNSGNNIVIRSVLEGFNEQEHPYLTLVSPSSAGQHSWIAYKQPTVAEISSDGVTPLNNWISKAGDLEEIVAGLTLLESEIIAGKEKFPSISRFEYKWAPWVLENDLLIKKRWITTTQSQASFCATISIPAETPTDRIFVHVNGVTLSRSDWSITSANKLRITKQLKLGCEVEVKILAYSPTKAELSFDPTVKEVPTTLKQYQIAYDYVETISYSKYGNKNESTYYYWVKKKVSPAVGKKQSIAMIANLLHAPTRAYCFPQIFKFYNQEDGRPNRYGMLIYSKLGSLASSSGRFKLRICDKPILRDNDNDLALKNLHEEWVLIRPKQAEKIPQDLWTAITNAACESNTIELLPSVDREIYDQEHNSNSIYGFKQDQIFAGGFDTRAAIKYAIENSTIYKYDQDFNKEVDYISYEGFDINSIDEYLATEENIRKFMSDLWRFAKPKQVNEIFFAVLDVAISQNYELEGIFKTSFISIFDVKILKTGEIGVINRN